MIAFIPCRYNALSLTLHFYKYYAPVNLSGNCSRKILDHKLHLSCSHYLPVTDELIPTGEIRSVKNTPFDFLCDASNGTVLGDVLGQIDGGGQPGLDHCLVVDGFVEAAQEADRTLRLRHVATLTDETSGRQLICRATLPAVQVYTANWLPADATQEPHVQHNAICLETQHYPDSPNQPTFPSTVLRPGEEYSHKVVFSFRSIA